MSRLDYTHILPMTVQNIMLEHMEKNGMAPQVARQTLIGIAGEMSTWAFYATDKPKEATNDRH